MTDQQDLDGCYAQHRYYSRTILEEAVSKMRRYGPKDVEVDFAACDVVEGDGQHYHVTMTRHETRDVA